MEKHLKSTYGFNNFRKHQKEIITDILNKKDVFAILPTGGGKSLLYQFPATFSEKITVVVSPLISLMNDQCQYLNSKNIKAVCLNSESCVTLSQYKNYKIIYTTPEFITSNIFSFMETKDNIGLFAIDEAHCVSQWSHDFRESYQQLNILKKHFPEIPLLAVTATATPHVLKEMYSFLNIKNASEYLLGTRRTNLAIKILPKYEFAKCTFEEPTIVYVQTRKICEKLHNNFLEQGIASACYHGGMEKNAKMKSHEQFIKGEIIVIVATISFGMGIDKSDIRHVINYGVPSNLESYYQEIGRAGRDGIDSKATLYYDEGDFGTTAFLISKSKNTKQKEIKTNMMNIFRRFLREKNLCRQQMIDFYFETGEFSTEDNIEHLDPCNMCDNCCNDHKQEIKDISKESQEIVTIISRNKSQKGFNVGMGKTLKLIQQSNTVAKKSVTWIRDIIEILVAKNILIRYKAGFGFVIGIGKIKIADKLPIMARIDDADESMVTIKTTNTRLSKLNKIRKKIAEKHKVLPAVFINDRVILNIHEKSPKSVSELWKVDGISNDFVMRYGSEFMAEFLKKPKKHNKKPKEMVLNFYNEGKTMKEMAEIMEVQLRTIEQYILYIFENNDDIDIDVDYFDLTEEIESEIQKAVAKVGQEFLRPIKDIVNSKITYAQIKLCLLIMKVENE
jgi:ATP-dependent DNA helicase RecQ